MHPDRNFFKNPLETWRAWKLYQVKWCADYFRPDTLFGFGCETCKSSSLRPSGNTVPIKRFPFLSKLWITLNRNFQPRPIIIDENPSKFNIVPRSLFNQGAARDSNIEQPNCVWRCILHIYFTFMPFLDFGLIYVSRFIE